MTVDEALKADHMPIHWRESVKGRWAVVVYSDPYTVAEWEQALTAILAHPIAAPPLRLLVDRRYCQAPPENFVRQITTFLRAHEERFADGHLAIVTADLAGFGVARMTESLVESARLSCTVRAFKDWAEAETWLQGAPRHAGFAT